MDFGMISYDRLTEEYFVLPEMPQPFLPGTRNKNPVFYLGLSNWNYKEDEKKKNSPDPQPGTLAFYANHFNASEFGITYDEMVQADKVSKWYKSVETLDFKCCPLFYKGITHSGKIDIQKLGLSSDFINRMKGLKEKLGTSILQLPDTYSTENTDSLLRYLEALPKDFNVSIEMRDAAWFHNPDRLGSFIEKLAKINKGLVITDSPGRRDAVHMQLSNATAVIRFNGLGWNELDLFRISQWKKQIQSWYLQGLEKCYFFLHLQQKEGEDDFIKYVQEEFRF